MERAEVLIDELMQVVSDESTPLGDVRQVLAAVECQRRRLDAFRLRLIAAAQSDGVPERGGHASTGSWVAKYTHTDGRRAASEAVLASALGNTPLADAPPVRADAAGPLRLVGDPSASPASEAGSAARSATGAALDAGRISAEHAQVIVRTLEELPEWVSPAQRTACETTLVDWSYNRAPARLRLIARRVLDTVTPEPQAARVDAHENNLIVAEEDAAVRAASFWMRDNHDGTTTGQFTVPTLAGAILGRVLDAMTAPRRQSGSLSGQNAGASNSAGKVGTARTHGSAGSAGSADEGADGWRNRQLDWQHRRGLALIELLEHLPTDHLHEKVASTVVITTRLGDLRGELVRAGRLDNAAKISAGEARRLACGAGLIPAVLGTNSVPIDLGRTTRAFTSAQKAALATAYSECATADCDRPVGWTETHHLTAWSHGGGTDLANAVPLCWAHHRRLHQGHPHTVHREPGGTFRIQFHRTT